MRYDTPAPEQLTGQWLTAQDIESEFVIVGMQIEGDTYHIGWSTKVTGDPGAIPPLPVIERLMQTITAAIDRELEAFVWEWDDA